MPEDNDGAAEFAPQDVEATVPEAFETETPVVDAAPEVEGEDIAPVEVETTPAEPEGSDEPTSEDTGAPLFGSRPASVHPTSKTAVAMSAEGGAVAEVPFRNQ